MNDDLVHGGALGAMAKAFPDAPRPWLDLSTGVNPWPYPFDDLPRGAFTALPDPSAEDAARAAMARAWGAAPDTIALTPGAEAAMRRLPFLLGARHVGILGPTYSGHESAWRLAGATVETTRDIPPDLARFSAFVVVNPNNPDGRAHAPEQLAQLHARLGRNGGALIVDESFGDLEPSASLAPFSTRDGLIVLKSFGKFFGLPGLRLGALLASPAIVARMKDALGAWPVSGPALAIARRAYEDAAWAAATRARLAAAAAALDETLQKAGARIAGGTTLFRLIDVNDAHVTWRRLAEKGVYVRRFAWSPRLLRIGLPSDARGHERLGEALTGAGL